jgi:hypothetical protein
MKSDYPFYTWVLPLIWGVCSYSHHYYPGDENGMWLISSAAGLWAAPFVFLGGASKPVIAGSIAAAGAVVMAGIGLAIDRLGVSKLLWAIVFPVCAIIVFAAAVMSYPSIERALSKNGSWWAYVLFSVNIGIYASIFLCVILTLIIRASRMASRD